MTKVFEFEETLKPFEKVEQQLIAFVPEYNMLNEVRQRVICDMCFNLGLQGLLGFKSMWKSISENNFRLASTEMLDSHWAHQVGMRANRLAKMMETGEDINKI